METFTAPKPLVDNPHYQVQREKTLANLCDHMIDPPIVDLINGFNRLPYCFTLQCCYAHFICHGQSDPHNLEPVPLADSIATVEYRIAYVAFCVEHSGRGKAFLTELATMAHQDPENIQFGSADWFWQRQVNSYVLQVEPDRFKFADRAVLAYQEALQLEKTRHEFFAQLGQLRQKQHIGSCVDQLT